MWRSCLSSLFLACAILSWGGRSALAVSPTVNGTLVGDESIYGDPLFVQVNTTGFGDSTDPSPQTSAGGSEIDGLYAAVADGRLYMLVTGNLESNFNKLDVFLDTVPGGFGSIPTDTMGGNSEFGNELPEVDPYINGSIDGIGALQKMDGLTFDAGFEADYYATFTNGTEGDIASWAFTVHYSPLQQLVSAGGSLPDFPAPQWGALGGSLEAQVSGGTLIDANTANVASDPDEQFFIDRQTDNSLVQMQAAIDNSNTQGVAGGNGGPADVDAALAVKTGIEWSISLDQIGSPTEALKIVAFINGVAHDYVANQVVGGLPESTGNLGPPAGVDFSALEGDQFVELRFSAGVIGDYSGNGQLDAADLDLQAEQMVLNPVPPPVGYDLNGDNAVDFADREIWLHNLKNVYVGDADLNGEFNSADFVQVFIAGKYETGQKALWEEGDWDGDQVFGSADFVAAFIDGGYELGPRPGAVSAVPEPSSVVLVLIGLAGLLGVARRR